MSDRTALILALILLAAFLADLALSGGATSLFLLRKLSQLVQFLVFWR